MFKHLAALTQGPFSNLSAGAQVPGFDFKQDKNQIIERVSAMWSHFRGSFSVLSDGALHSGKRPRVLSSRIRVVILEFIM